MAHSPRYEAYLEAAWQDLLASLDALCPELKIAPPLARRKALAAVAHALRESGLKRLPLVTAILADLRSAARGTGRRSSRRTSSMSPVC